MNKNCVVCGSSLPFTDEYFPVDKRLKYGLLSTCRVCRRKQCTKSDSKKREKIKTKHQEELNRLEKILIEMSAKQKYGRKKDGE